MINITVHFDSFGIEYISQEVLGKIKVKSITHTHTHIIFRIQSDDSVACGFYYIASIEYMIVEKTFLDYTNLFSPNDYQKITR